MLRDVLTIPVLCDILVAIIESAIAFHIETFGTEVFEGEPTILEAFVVETRIAV